MKINIKATNIELTPEISDYTHKKVSSIEKYLPLQTDNNISEGDIVAHVEVGKTTKHHKAGEIFRSEVHIVGGGLDIYATSEQEDLTVAIDLVRDEVIRSATQIKGNQETLTRRGAKMVKYMMKGLSDSTTRGFAWGVDRFRFKGFKSFKKRQ